MNIKGTIAEIRYRNDENGYTIATVETDLQPFTVVGVFPPCAEGSYVSCEGNFITHPKYGRQFKADTVRPMRPESAYGLIQFLSSGMIKGVGEKRAVAIVEKFGENALDVIEKEPKRLAEISGISTRMADEIASSYNEVKKVADVMTFLMEYGVGSSLAMKIYKEYGDDTIATVSSNPYRLIEDVSGIGFRTADRMASALGIDRKSDFRVRAAIYHILTTCAERDGNTLMLCNSLMTEALTLLEFDESDASRIVDNIDEMLLSRKLREVTCEGENAFMTAPLYNAEYSSAVKLCRMLEHANHALPDVTAEIAEFERIEGVTFHEQQRQAISTALDSGVCVITGGPGTGKTTIMRCVLRILIHHGFTVKLMAPTGRASKRLSESTSSNASTIHRALMGVTDDESGLNADAIIVDEFSMVDVHLLSSLLAELRDDAKLIIVGDADQLPSVGAGNVLADVISSGIIPVASLTHVYRQDEGSRIITNAHKINDGIFPDLSNDGKDFFFIRANTPEEIATTTVDLVTRRLPSFTGFKPEQIQVLCPMKNGEAGTIRLNKLLRDKILGKVDKEITVGELTVGVGDKVMHTVNNYSLCWTRNYRSGEGVFNGDMGFVSDVRPDSGEIIVELEDGRRVTYTGEDRKELMLAYAVTVHKSQGSEYEVVVIPVSGNAPMLMTRNLLYTAVTRAKNVVVLVGTENAVARMVNNDYIQKRYSKLADFLVETSRKFSLLYGKV